MSHRDQEGHTASASHAQDLRVVFQWLLKGVDWSSIGLRRDSRLTPRGLALVALLWVWSDKTALTERFGRALKIGQRLFPGDVPESISYQAFMKLLVRWTPVLVSALTAALRRRMETALASRFRIAGFAVFGGDGSRLELSRTASNEARFSPRKSRPQVQKHRHKKHGKKKKRKYTKTPPRQRTRRKPSRRTARARRRRAVEKKADSPQLWITALWHAASGLPWDWRIGPSDSSERHHLREMIDGLPPDALLTADAGFVGYDFWAALLAGGRQFVIRVGSNVRLLKKLGSVRESGQTVYLWPDRAAQKQQPPLVLRLVVVHNGRHPLYLVTSVGDRRRLSDRQVAEIYRLRWGIELYYRHFKQTFNRRKLRSHKADHVEVEAHWSMIGLWAMLLHAQQHLKRRHVPADEISVASVLRAYRLAMDEYKSAPDPEESLWDLLRIARLDDYERTDKTSRGYPRKKYDKPPGEPKLTHATRQQIHAAREAQQKPAAKRLTA